jgi:hypothetical protein
VLDPDQAAALGRLLVVFGAEQVTSIQPSTPPDPIPTTVPAPLQPTLLGEASCTSTCT